MNKSKVSDLQLPIYRRIYHWATWAMPPPFELRKNLVYGKNATKMRHFQAKMSKIFSGMRGHSPLPRTYPHWGGKYPWPDHSPSAPQLSTPSIFFPNFYHYARLRCCYWRISEIESSASFVSRPRLIKWNALEVGPVNIQSSHWINLLMQFVMDWHTPANSIINIRHSVRITFDIYTPKHTFLWPFCEILRANAHEKSLKLFLPDVRF